MKLTKQMIDAAYKQFGIRLDQPEEYAAPDNPFEPTESPLKLPPNPYVPIFTGEYNKLKGQYPEIADFDSCIFMTETTSTMTSSFKFTMLFYKSSEETKVCIANSGSELDKWVKSMRIDPSSKTLDIYKMGSNGYVTVKVQGQFNKKANQHTYTNISPLEYKTKDPEYTRINNDPDMTRLIYSTYVPVDRTTHSKVFKEFTGTVSRGGGYFYQPLYEQLLPTIPKLKRNQNSIYTTFQECMKYFMYAKNNGQEIAYIFRDAEQGTADGPKITPSSFNKEIIEYQKDDQGCWYQVVKELRNPIVINKGNYTDILTNNEKLHQYLTQAGGYTGLKELYKGFPSNWKKNLAFLDSPFWFVFDFSSDTKYLVLCETATRPSSSGMNLTGTIFKYFKYGTHWEYSSTGSGTGIANSTKNASTNHKGVIKYFKSKGWNNLKDSSSCNDGLGGPIKGDLFAPDLNPSPDPEPEKPSTAFPFNETKYLKHAYTQTKNLEECFTFTEFEKKTETSFYLRGPKKKPEDKNGYFLKYRKEDGCWHQQKLDQDQQIFNVSGRKDFITNDKALADFLEAAKVPDKGKIIYKEGFPTKEYEEQFCLNSKGLYFAKFELRDPKRIVVFIFNRAEDNVLYEIIGAWRLEAPYDDWREGWKKEWDDTSINPESTYVFNKGKSQYPKFKTNHKLLHAYCTREGYISDDAQFISPCTDLTPEGNLPPGVQGPNKPPKPGAPGSGEKDPLGPPKPPDQPKDPSVAIRPENVEWCNSSEHLDTLGNIANNKLNGLFYYYLEDNLYGANNLNTKVLGTTEAICNVCYAPFLNLIATDLCKADFDVERYKPDEEQFESPNIPKVFRVKGSYAGRELEIGKWKAYPSNVGPNSNPKAKWSPTYESRLYDYPYRQVTFFSNLFEVYNVIPHLYFNSAKTNDITLKAFCPITPGGNFSVYVEKYKGDSTGFVERQFSSTSMDIPNTSSAYSNYMSTQKAQVSAGLQQSALSSLGSAVPTIAPTMLAAAAIPGVNIATVGAAAVMAAAGSAGTSTLQQMHSSMAYRSDLMTTPKSLKSMGGDLVARLGDENVTRVFACDMQITDEYKDLLARFFHMFGTKQNRVMDVDSLINSRYYFNYIKTAGCNVSANGVPKKHVSRIKAILNNGTTFWHVDRPDVVIGEYCVYDNCEV